MKDKIIVIFGSLLLYVLGYRPYNLCAKWTSFNSELAPFGVVLLPKGISLTSGEALSTALDQIAPFAELFKQNYTFDHFERASLWSYIEDKLLWC